MKANRLMSIVRMSKALLLCFWFGLPTAWAGNPTVKIARHPLLADEGSAPPNVVLNLSTEYSAAGAAYRREVSYDKLVEYVGYFNPLKCYGYNGSNRNLKDDGYFYILRNADPVTHECAGDSFSGNFMNWAVSSTLDMIRYALTGGDRVIDTPTATVLQRAVLREAPQDDFYAHRAYFPRREVSEKANMSAPNRVTPFNVKTLYVVSCRNRILFSDVSSGLEGQNSGDSREASSYCAAKYDGKGGPAREALDKRLGEYLARVKVCDDKEGASRTDLCHKYGSHYKPIGEIQRKSGTMRLAVMGYLLDDSAKRYGGVLRSPMKHVGPNSSKAPGFAATENEFGEWNAATGVFHLNPDIPHARHSTGTNSGLINYINKFGRSGLYKTYDPLSELYYEAIRYLQGLQATPEATAGMKEAMRDGFPVLTNWADPVLASCQRNYIVAVADANTHWDRYVPGNERTRYGVGHDAHDSPRPVEAAIPGKTPLLDVKVWTRKVEDKELDAHGIHADATDLDGLHNRDTGAEGRGTYYIAGLAHWSHNHDIRLDIPARVTTFSIDLDEGGNGSMDTSPRIPVPRHSQLYLAAKYGGSTNKERASNPFLNNDTEKSSMTRNERLAAHKKRFGMPSNYFLAGEPRDLIQALRKVFAQTGAITTSFSRPALSAARYAANEEYMYVPGYDASTWSGSLKKIALPLNSKGEVTIERIADWDAGEILTGADDHPGYPAASERNIYTAVINSDQSITTVEFRWSELFESQKSLLNLSPIEKTNDGLGEQRLQYLRGQRDREIGQISGIFLAYSARENVSWAISSIVMPSMHTLSVPSVLETNRITDSIRVIATDQG